MVNLSFPKQQPAAMLGISTTLVSSSKLIIVYLWSFLTGCAVLFCLVVVYTHPTKWTIARVVVYGYFLS